MTFNDIAAKDLTNKTDLEYYHLAFSYSVINHYMVQEVNNDGGKFNYDSQVGYRAHYEGPLLNFNLKDLVPSSFRNSEIRIIILLELKEMIKNNIYIYEQYKKIFDNLSRKELMINHYRKEYKKGENYSDVEIFLEIARIRELQNRDQYLKSKLFEHVGFLEINYHKYIYENSIHLQKQFENNFEDYQHLPSFYPKVYSEPFFSLKMTGLIYNFCNGEYFEQVSEPDFYRDLNLMSNLSKLEIKENRKVAVLYLIHRIESLLKEDERTEWREGFCTSIRISKDYYKSKYRHVVSANASDQDKIISKDIDKSIDEIKDELCNDTNM
ncbi:MULTISPECIES: hypothetical protein [Chitinophagaceae]